MVAISKYAPRLQTFLHALPFIWHHRTKIHSIRAHIYVVASCCQVIILQLPSLLTAYIRLVNKFQGKNTGPICLKFNGKGKKMLGYSLHLVILLCRLHNLSQIIGPVHTWFHLNSPASIQSGCSLVHRTDQLSFPSLPSLFTVPIFTSLIWRGNGNGLAQGPHYDRFSQDLNPLWSDHWYTPNSSIVAT